jgi:hypothetical protein
VLSAAGYVSVSIRGEARELGGFTALDAVTKKETSATNGSKIGMFKIKHSHYAD